LKNDDLFLLDTSALMAFLEDEAGADRVEELLRKGAILSSISLLEVYYITLREQGELSAEQRYALLKRLPLNIIWEMNEPVLLRAGHYKSRYQISLTDALIAALTWSNEAVLVHKDPEYNELEEEKIRMERLPYKKKGK